MRIPQLDDFTGPDLMRKIGAVRTFGSRAGFYYQLPQLIMIAGLFYFQVEALQSLVPTIWHWVGIIVALGVVVVLIDYTVVYPAQITFRNDQSDRRERNPSFALTQDIYNEMHERLDRLEGRIGADHADVERAVADGGRVLIVPECPDCERGGVPDDSDHDAENTIVCPDCRQVLYGDTQS